MDPIIAGVVGSPFFSAAAFFAGLLLGNWLAIGRDRRKERIEAAKEIREILFAHRRNPSPYDRSPSAFQYDTLRRLLPLCKRNGFRKAIERYQESRNDTKQDELGEVFYRDTDTVTAKLERLIAYTDWR